MNSKKAEEAALKAYPVNMVETVDYIFGSKCKTEVDANERPREKYAQGYADGSKDTEEDLLIRAVRWLEKNVWESTGVDYGVLTDSFMEAMKKDD